MTCDEFRESHPRVTSPGRAHLASCGDCRAFARAWDLLEEHRPIAPGPDFFRGIRRKLAPRILRFAAAVSAAAAALLVAVVLWHAPASDVTEEERELVENLELLQNYELVRTLELVNESGSTILEERR